MAQTAMALAMSTALDKAGVVLPIDQAYQDALEAWDQRPGSNGKLARLRYLESAFAHEKTFAVLKAWHPTLVDDMILWLLAKTEPAPSRRRAALREVSLPPAPPPASDAESCNEIEKTCRERTEIKRERSEKVLGKAIVRQLSRLDNFKLNGQSIGDVTSEEANRWADSQTRDVLFVRLLTRGLPPDRPIREFIQGAEADALYLRVEQEQQHVLAEL
jgi:hypothetical protein